MPPGTGGRLILLCGLPGSGKTTLAERLASESAVVRLSPDDWLARLGIDLYDKTARDRLERLFWSLAQDVLRVGGTVVLESGFWQRSERDQKRAGARALGAAVELRYLDATLDELERRLNDRDVADSPASARVTRAQLDSWAEDFEAPDEIELALFDPPGGHGLP
jgi:predicted kinase